MISSATSIRIAHREPQPPVPPTGHESPGDARDGGWLGQVPPPAGSTPTTPPAPPYDPAYDTGPRADARDDGWLGQVPPPPPSGAPHETARRDETPPPPPGSESPTGANDDGWLGQVPPPARPTAAVDDAQSAVTFANPQLAPDPWSYDAPLFPDDPTLFG